MNNELKKKLRRLAEQFFNLVNTISAVLLGSSVILYAFNCFMRYVVGKAIPWPEEYCTYIVVLMVWFMTCRMEFFEEELCIGLVDAWAAKSKPLRYALLAFQFVVTIFIYGVLIKVADNVVAQQFRFGAISPVIHFSMGMYFTLIKVCFILVIVAWIINLLTRDYGSKEAQQDE